MAAYNRRDLTLACLRSLEAQRAPGVVLDAFVLDDASTDGTAEAIAREFPATTVIRGDGQLYWNGGMRSAFGAAIGRDYDFYLWMNDDTALDERALAVLLDAEGRLRAGGEEAVIVAGSTRDPENGELTYGGLVRPSRWRPLRWELVEPAADQPRACETINGNTVLISRAVVRRVGNIDPAFVQQMGDHDYGLRARAAGCSVWIAPGTLGTCAPNLRRPPGEAPFLQEWRRVWSTKELLPGPWAVFSRRWAGRLWPVYWLSPYLRAGFRLLRGRLHTRRAPTRAR
jgi:GT2 family glycosyltransferase